MSTIVNNPPAVESDTGGLGTIIGAILLVALVFLLIFYGLPLLRGSAPAPGTATQQQGPSSESKSGIQVDTPDKIDIQVQPGQ